jgi:hypothetical protein
MAKKPPPSEKNTGQVELFREISPRVPWLGAEGGKWKFKCLTLAQELDQLESANGTCLISMGGLLSTPQKLTDSSVSYIDKVGAWGC